LFFNLKIKTTQGNGARFSLLEGLKSFSNHINTIDMDQRKKFSDKVKEAFKNVFDPSSPSIDEIKEEIWCDLSHLYYKYEDPDQKRAFREVLNHIAEKIGESKWSSVYKKLYRMENEKKRF